LKFVQNFDDSTKLFSDLYLAKFLDILEQKCFLLCVVINVINKLFITFIITHRRYYLIALQLSKNVTIKNIIFLDYLIKFCYSIY